jgi:hypothetical protein
MSILAGCQDAPTSTATKPKIHQHSHLELNGPMPQAYRDFVRHVDAYGALYVTQTGGGGGRIGGKSSLEEAKAGALAQCRKFNPDMNCILYATKSP